MGTLKTPPRRRRHVGARRARLGIGRRHDDQRPWRTFNFSYDGVTNKDTGSNSGNYAAPGPRFHRGSQGAGLELPGRVRPHLGRDDRRRHQERQLQIPGHRPPTSGATRTSTRTRGIGAGAATRTRRRRAPQPELQKPRYRYNNTAWTIGGPVLIPGTSFNERARQAVLLLVAGHPAAQRSGRSAATARCRRRSNAQGDFSQTVDNQGSRDSSGIRACARDLRATSTRAGRACFAGNIIPSRP